MVAPRFKVEIEGKIGGGKIILVREVVLQIWAARGCKLRVINTEIACSCYEA